MGFALTAKQAGTRGESTIGNAELPRIIATAFSQTGEGAIEFGDLSSAVASTVAQVAAKTGAEGTDEILEITAIIQALGKSLKSADEVATLAERFFSRVGLGVTQKKLSKLGIDIADDEGRIAGTPLETVLAIANNEQLDNPQLRQAAFKDLLGEEAAATLISAQQRDPELLNRLATASPEEGERVISLVNERLDASPFSEIDSMNIAAQSVTLQGGDLVELQKTLARERGEFLTEHPIAAEVAGPIAQTAAGAGLGSLFGSLLGGGGKKAGAGMLGRALPAVGRGAMAAGRLAIPALAAMGPVGWGILAGGAGLAATEYFTDGGVSDWFGGMFGGGDDKPDPRRARRPALAPGHDATSPRGLGDASPFARADSSGKGLLGSTFTRLLADGLKIDQTGDPLEVRLSREDKRLMERHGKGEVTITIDQKGQARVAEVSSGPSIDLFVDNGRRPTR